MSSSDLASLEAAIAAYCVRDETVDDAALSDELLRKRALINHLELDFARDAARFAATHTEEVFGDPSPVSWMRAECRTTSHAAACAIDVGQQSARLERSTEALIEGRIGFAHLALMASTAAALDCSSTATRVFDDGRLLAKAETLTVVRFHRECAHLRHAGDREAFLADEADGHEARSLRLRPMGESGPELPVTSTGRTVRSC